MKSHDILSSWTFSALNFSKYCIKMLFTLSMKFFCIPLNFAPTASSAPSPPSQQGTALSFAEDK